MGKRERKEIGNGKRKKREGEERYGGEGRKKRWERREMRRVKKEGMGEKRDRERGKKRI